MGKSEMFVSSTPQWPPGGAETHSFFFPACSKSRHQTTDGYFVILNARKLRVYTSCVSVYKLVINKEKSVLLVLITWSPLILLQGGASRWRHALICMSLCIYLALRSDAPHCCNPDLSELSNANRSVYRYAFSFFFLFVHDCWWLCRLMFCSTVWFCRLMTFGACKRSTRMH